MAEVFQVENLLSVIVQCFALILAGYASGRVGLINDLEAKGLAHFVSFFSLPALIFRSLATLAFGDICWTFVSGILVSKILVFVLVAAVSLLLNKSTGAAGLFGIACTQSNDFAIGYPIVSSLYVQSHPLFADYLYVLAPVQLLILNPAGIFMLELSRRLSDVHLHTSPLVVSVLWGVLRNPVILMTLAGLAWNLLGPDKLPVLLAPVLDALAQSFSAAALFLVGLSMVGKFQPLMRGSVALLLPVLLAVVKVMLLPLVIWFVLEHVLRDRASLSLANFGYLYGTLPTAPTVFVFALQFGTETQTVASALVLTTVFAAPIMFVCANMIRLSDAQASTTCSNATELMSTSVLVSIVSLPLLLWTLCAMLVGKKWSSLTHRVTIIMLSFQVLVNAAAILSRYSPEQAASMEELSAFSLLRIRLVLSVLAATGVRVWAAILALTLSLLRVKSLCFVIRFQWVAHAIGSFALIAVMVVSSVLLTPHNSCSYSSCSCTSYQSYLSLVVTIVCAVVSFAGVVTTQKLLNKRSQETDLLVNSAVETETEDPLEAEACAVHDVEDVATFCADRKACSSHAGACTHAVAVYQRNLSQTVEAAREVGCDERVSSIELHDVSPHITLLITLILSMTVQAVVYFGQLAFEASAGAFLHLQYLNAVLVHAQGIFFFMIFGFNADSVYRKVTRCLRFFASRLRIETRAQ